MLFCFFIMQIVQTTYILYCNIAVVRIWIYLIYKKTLKNIIV